MFAVADVVSILREEKDGKALESIFSSKKELRRGGGGDGGGDDAAADGAAK